MAGEGLELDRAQLAGDRERLHGTSAALRGMPSVQQRRMTRHQGDRERIRLSSRRAISTASPAAGGRLRRILEHEVLGEAREQADAQRAVARLERRQRLLEQADVGVIRRPRRIEMTAGAEHRPRQPLRGAQPAGELDRLHERRARVRPAGSASGAERQQHVTAGGRRRAARSPAP